MKITEEMARAIDLIENTREPVYITGKAGTGKTTLLRYIVETIHKNFVVTASTGVAAVNAGGVTLHSLLNIPFGCLNNTTPVGALSPTKSKIINQLEVLVIDEVSMLRPDVLDFIDRKLRTYRRCDLPFGGVQIIMFGDLYQLPPVIKSEESVIMRMSYSGNYFFYAHVWKKIGFHIVELNHIFRQSDPHFISILNNIRSYRAIAEDIEELAELRNLTKSGEYDSDAVHICTHKKDVQSINSELLGEPTHTFKAQIQKRFNPNSAPCDIELQLRVGARIMMLTNNHEVGYCNGSLGYITAIHNDKISVELDNGVETDVAPYQWESIEYSIENDKVIKNVVGTCTQYPLTLAWAITIHKSQGLTFPSVVIHNKKTFCPGQLYVALSRCTSMEGITLEAFVTKRQIMPDNDLIRFEAAVNETGGEFNAETYKILTA